MRPVVSLLWLLLVVTTGLLGTSQMLHAQSTTPDDPAQLLDRLRHLHLLSGGLIEKAGSGSTPANDFQIQTRLYREQLRQTMLANRELPAKQQLPKTLLLSMVQMSALLHAAADCKSGRVITCPPDLLRQLRAQQAAVGDAFKMFDATTKAPS